MATFADYDRQTDGPGSIIYRGHRIHEDRGAFTVLGFQGKLRIQSFPTPHDAQRWLDTQWAKALVTHDEKA